MLLAPTLLLAFFQVPGAEPPSAQLPRAQAPRDSARSRRPARRPEGAELFRRRTRPQDPETRRFQARIRHRSSDCDCPRGSRTRFGPDAPPRRLRERAPTPEGTGALERRHELRRETPRFRGPRELSRSEARARELRERQREPLRERDAGERGQLHRHLQELRRLRSELRAELRELRRERGPGGEG